MESTNVQLDNWGSRWPTIEFMKTVPGMMTLLNFIMLMICWGLMVDWKIHIEEPYASKLEKETGYYLFATLSPWFLYIVFYISLFKSCDEQLEHINWRYAFFLFCALWNFLLFVAVCIIFIQATIPPCYACLCFRLYAAGAFGFLTSCGLGYQGYCHYSEYKQNSIGNHYPTAAVV